jgi:hypothetical protein
MADSGRDEHAELIAFLREQEEARQRFFKKQKEKRDLDLKKYDEDEAKKKEELKREIEEYDRKIAMERARAPREEPGVSLAIDDEPQEEFLELDRPDFEVTQTIGRGRKQKKIVKRSSKTKRKGGKRRSSKRRSKRKN